MLTKDLLRYRRAASRVIPRFIDAADQRLLDLAGELIYVYESEGKPSRGEIDELVNPLVNGAGDVVLARGLDKLLRDRAEFTPPGEVDYVERRRRVFAAAADALAGEAAAESADYRSAVLAAAGFNAAEWDDGQLYGDLTDQERLVKFKPISPRQLLERYNTATVQSLLLRSASLRVEIGATAPPRLRNLCKYLKFFRLLAKFERSTAEAGGKAAADSALVMTIDGPASVLDNSRKYGLQLASFFPALCELDEWRLTADISLDIGKPPTKLLVDQSAGLKSHYHHFGDHVPEEFALFAAHFAAAASGWQLLDSLGFVDLGGQELIFPDFAFSRGDGGEVVSLELFHRWHGAQLPRRLAMGDAGKLRGLIVGVDRHLTRDPLTKEALDSSPWFKANGFLFRDFPGVDNVVKTLGKSPGTLRL